MMLRSIFPVRSLVTSTLTLETTAPSGSLTIPVRPPVKVLWAKTLEKEKMEIANAVEIKTRGHRKPGSFGGIHPVKNPLNLAIVLTNRICLKPETDERSARSKMDERGGENIGLMFWYCYFFPRQAEARVG